MLSSKLLFKHWTTFHLFLLGPYPSHSDDINHIQSRATSHFTKYNDFSPPEISFEIPGNFFPDWRGSWQLTPDVLTRDLPLAPVCNPSSQFPVAPGFPLREKYLCMVGHEMLYNLQINDLAGGWLSNWICIDNYCMITTQVGVTSTWKECIAFK